MNSFYTPEELSSIGFRTFGENVLISRKASIYSPANISIGNHVRIDDFCILSGGKSIQLGSYIHISAYAALYGGAGIVMADYTGLSPRSTLNSESDDFSGNSMIHPFFSKEFKPGFRSQEIIMRKFAQVGTNSTILPGVELGEGVAVGAHSLVTSSCKPWGIYAGVPASHIKERSRKMLDLEKEFRARKNP